MPRKKELIDEAGSCGYNISAESGGGKTSAIEGGYYGCDTHKTKSARKQKGTKTILQKFYQVVFRRKRYNFLEELQADLDTWIDHYNNGRTHQGKRCCGRTPMQTLLDGKAI